MSTSNDPLLQPYQLRHLTLRNRIMTTSHEPAYPEEGMPKARYRAYHVARAAYVKLRLADPKELDGLLDEAAYQSFVEEQH